MAFKLIVADRSPSIQKAVQMAFSDSEFEVFTFNDGLDVMESLSHISPDAVLLNLSLPGKDGVEVGFYLKGQEEFRHTSLILLRSAFEFFDRDRVAGLDYDEIIQEPFDSERLARIVKDLIERKRDPQTLPEEPLFEEVSVTEPGPDIDKEEPHEMASSQDDPIQARELSCALTPEQKFEIEKIVRDLMKSEILDVERELEKRITARALVDIRERIRKELEEFRKQNGTEDSM